MEPGVPPNESTSSYRVHQISTNQYYDDGNGSRWTRFVGAGVGVARTSLGYTRRVVRKTLEQGCQDVEPPRTVADRPAAAAGTVSLLEPDVSGRYPDFRSWAA